MVTNQWKVAQTDGHGLDISFQVSKLSYFCVFERKFEIMFWNSFTKNFKSQTHYLWKIKILLQKNSDSSTFDIYEHFQKLFNDFLCVYHRWTRDWKYFLEKTKSLIFLQIQLTFLWCLKTRFLLQIWNIQICVVI